MLTLPIPSKDRHLYENGNQDITTFLKTGVDVDKNVVTTKGKVPLEIN
jgi:hypothetical protein